MGGKNNFAIAAQGQVISLSEVRRAGRLPFALPTKEKGLLLAPIPVARAPVSVCLIARRLLLFLYYSFTLPSKNLEENLIWQCFTKVDYFKL